MWRGEEERTSEMAGDVVALGAASVAVLPLASEAEVVGGLSADVVVAEVGVEQFWVGECGGAPGPLTAVVGRHWRGTVVGNVKLK